MASNIILLSFVTGSTKRRGGRSIEHLVRRDPRDISCIFFFDPDSREYVRVPYRDISLPSVNLWDFKNARKWLVSEGHKHVDEARIFAALERQRDAVDTAKKETKKARRDRQRRKERGSKSIFTELGTDSTPDNHAHESFRDDDEFVIPEEELEPQYKERKT